MEKPDGSTWLIVWEIAKWILAAMGAAVSGVGMYLLRLYGNDRAMVKRHEELLSQDKSERGENLVFRIEAMKAPYGEKLNAALQELKESDDKLHARLNRAKQRNERLKNAIIAMKTDLRWIRKTLSDKGHDDK